LGFKGTLKKLIFYFVRCLSVKLENLKDKYKFKNVNLKIFTFKLTYDNGLVLGMLYLSQCIIDYRSGLPIKVQEYICIGNTIVVDEVSEMSNIKKRTSFLTCNPLLRRIHENILIYKNL
jgi:hypothetical protein